MIGQLILDLVRRWRLLLACGASGALVAVIFCLVQTPKFQVSATVGPNPRDERALEGLGGAAALLLSADRKDSSFEVFQFLLRSDELANVLLANQPGLIRLMFPKRWDEQSGQWKPRSGIGGAVVAVNGLFGITTVPSPTVQEVGMFLRKELSLGTIEKVPYKRISIEHENPLVGAQILNEVIQAADMVLRQRDREKSERSLAYLNRELENAPSNEQRRFMLDSIEREFRRLTLARSGDSYSMVVLSPVTPSQVPTSPKPLLALVIMSILGTLSGAIIVGLRFLSTYLIAPLEVAQPSRFSDAA